jgi:protein-tyrosine phosphatase
MTDAVYSLIANGYKPVIAHAERYKEIQKDVFLCDELKNRGALIQINSSSILGEDGFNIKRCAKKILKLKLADIVASDSHGTEFRKNTLAKAYDFVVKKYGDDYAEDIFVKNPRDIIYIKDPERKTSDE